MKLETYANSNVGKHRNNNEDAYLISKISIRDEDLTDEILIAVALDGVGGLEGGELASYTAAKEYLKSLFSSLLGIDNIFNNEQNEIKKDNIVKFNVKITLFGIEKNEEYATNGIIEKDEADVPITDLKYISALYFEKMELNKIEKLNKFYKEKLSPIINKAMKQSNDAVNNIKKNKENSPGTTFTGAIFFNKKLLITNIGDSRAYRFRENDNNSSKKENEIKLKRISKDHSYVQELVDEKLITPEQARFHPNKNIVTKCIGVGKSDSSDHYIYSVKNNDIYLLSSDGLHDLLSDSEISVVINNNKNNLKEMGDKLVSIALENGGYDNITVVLAKDYE